jgi:hypothetical protein
MNWNIQSSNPVKSYRFFFSKKLRYSVAGRGLFFKSADIGGVAEGKVSEQ